MSEAEKPDRFAPERPVTVDDVRQLMGASTPHFAMHLRNRIAKLIRGLPAEDPARQLGEEEIARLDRLGFTGEVRGIGPQEGERRLRSVNPDEPTRRVAGTRGPLGEPDRAAPGTRGPLT